MSVRISLSAVNADRMLRRSVTRLIAQLDDAGVSYRAANGTVIVNAEPREVRAVAERAPVEARPDCVRALAMVDGAA